MSTQLNLLGRSVNVRPTSIEARRSITKDKISRVQAAILAALPGYGSRTDEQIAHVLALRGIIVSPSGARTRRAELVKLGKVEACGQTRNARGLKVTLWRATRVR